MAAIKGMWSPSSTSHTGSLTQDPYEVRRMALPLGVKANPTRSVAPSKSLARDVLLQDVCDVAGWFFPHTFIKFYSLDTDSSSGSQVLQG